jgi:hypothetical protein
MPRDFHEQSADQRVARAGDLPAPLLLAARDVK